MDLKVQTVLGPVPPESLGRTLTHEHFSLNFDKFYVAPPKSIENVFDNTIHLENVGYVRQYPYSSKYNIEFCDRDTHNAINKEVLTYKNAGGGTIVENTSHGLGRNVQLMKNVSEASGVNVVAGTGHYVALVQPQSVLQKSQQDLYETILKELTEGCIDNLNIKCGFIGEVGSAWPLHEFEIRAIRATAAVQEHLRCPVSFHPGRHPKAPFEIMRLFLEAGGKSSKTVMSHLDRTLVQDGDLLDFAKLGTYCQFDLFGTECSHYQIDPATDMPSDAQRISKVKLLLENNHLQQILMSHDVHTKHRLIKYGGHGYSHILTNILPKMLTRGFSQEMLDQITIKNPASWLAWKAE
ncbi:hypothetical protein R5R35_007212 [Gryllus longicercus]|uniref:Parathion hydrolase-related protein n=1 Tax=Gryllus longicercus TaxID=2509291 RepID=A0AAN9Z5M5_9ORTH